LVGKLQEHAQTRTDPGTRLHRPRAGKGDTLVELVFGQEVQELGEDGATFVHKLENRQTPVIHPQRIVVKLKSKKAMIAKTRPFYMGKIAASQNLTGHQ
jgi:hypothetical protein